MKPDAGRPYLTGVRINLPNKIGQLGRTKQTEGFVRSNHKSIGLFLENL